MTKDWQVGEALQMIVGVKMLQTEVIWCHLSPTTVRAKIKFQNQPYYDDKLYLIQKI